MPYADPEKNKAIKRQWALDNPDKVKESHKKSYYKHRDERKEKQKVFNKRHYDAHKKELQVSALKRYHSVVKLRKYKITQQEVENILKHQNNKCAICGTDNWGYNGPAIDHNHITGKVRGFLCNKCNLALGLIKDSQEVAISMATYLSNNQ
jgi:hypothetical protein